MERFLPVIIRICMMGVALLELLLACDVSSNL
jgi:hypothetical protein